MKNAACCGPQGAVGPRELDFPYYSLRDGFSSTLYLVSDSPQDIPLTIAIRNLAGQAVFASPTIAARQRLTFDLRALLVAQGADPTNSFAEGSVAVYFTGTIMPVVGQITISNPVTHLVHESEMQENDPGRSDIPTVQNGLWWGLSGGRDARIMVSNTKGQSVVADVFLDSLGQPHQVSQSGISFMPHETKVLSVSDMLGQLGFSPAQVPQGGITIVARGGVGGLMAQGKILDPVTGFSTTLRFPSPDAQISNALHAVGIPIGKPSLDSPFAGMGMFVPHAIVRNLTGTDQQVTVTIEYRQGALVEMAKKHKDSKTDSETYREFDGEGGSGTGQLTLPPFTLPAYTTQDISLLSALGQLPLPIAYASVRIQYNGKAGSVIAELASVDDGQDLVVDSHVVNEGYGWMGSGANPWRLDDQTESFLFLTDMGQQPVRMGFLVSVGDTHQYLAELQIAPHETRVINLRKLRDTQRADFKGNKIPPAATDGVVHWIRIDNVPVAGRVVTINRYTGTASNYDCCYAPCPANFVGMDSIDPSSDGVPVGAYDYYDAYAGYYDPNDGYYTVWVTGAATWSTGNSNVTSSQGSGEVLGVTLGSTFASATYSDCGDWEYDPTYGVCSCDSPYQGTCSAAVNVGGPHISSISPTLGPVGTAINVTITGTGFASGANVNAGSNITVSNVNVTSSTQITATFKPTNSTSAGGNQGVTVSIGSGPRSNSYNFYDQVPTALSVLTSSIDSAAAAGLGCTGNYYGILISIQYQVLDQETPPISIYSALEPDEAEGNTVSSGQPPTGPPLSSWEDLLGPGGLSDSYGVFTDSPNGTCNNTNTFYLGEAQHIAINIGGTEYPVRVNPWIIQGLSGGHGSTTNQIDVSLSR